MTTKQLSLFDAEVQEAVVASQPKRRTRKARPDLRKNIIGEVYGYLTIVGEDIEREEQEVALGKKRSRFAIAECDCGNRKTFFHAALRRGNTKSCGCGIAEHGRTLHGGRSRKPQNREFTQFYQTWFDMVRRCEDPTRDKYARYGARGITVCEEWYDYNNFVQWALYESNLAEFGGEMHKGLTIDRIDNDGNYEPSNCRFATRKQQANNTSKNIRITIEGRTQTLMDWCEERNADYGRAKARYYAGYEYDIVFDTELDLRYFKRKDLEKMRTRNKHAAGA